jgi:hypothetical protein
MVTNDKENEARKARLDERTELEELLAASAAAYRRARNNAQPDLAYPTESLSGGPSRT